LAVGGPPVITTRPLTTAVWVAGAVGDGACRYARVNTPAASKATTISGASFSHRGGGDAANGESRAVAEAMRSV
jgi:hypothetical protein